MARYSGPGSDPNWRDLNQWGSASGPQTNHSKGGAAFHAAQGPRGAQGRINYNKGFANLGAAVHYAGAGNVALDNLSKAMGELEWTAGSRALHMAAYTEQYLPPSINSYFNKVPGGTRQTAGKYLAEAFGWAYDPGSGPKGDKMIRYMGKSQGFLGLKHFANQGPAAFLNFGAVATTGFAALSLAYTADLMYEGYQRDGLTGAALGLGESVGTAYVFRSVIPRVFDTNLNAAKTAYGSVRAGLEVGAALGRVGATGGGIGYWGARAASIGAGITAGAAAGIAASVFNPYAWAIAGGLYAYDQASEFIDEKNRAAARLKQVRSLELGAPVLDQFGTIATLRQRSLSAIQNSHVNGRMALGSEAALLHSTF